MSERIAVMRDPYHDAAARGWKVIDASRLDHDLTIEADVVIVGTGAGGGTTAEVLTAEGLTKSDRCRLTLIYCQELMDQDFTKEDKRRFLPLLHLVESEKFKSLMELTLMKKKDTCITTISLHTA